MSDLYHYCRKNVKASYISNCSLYDYPDDFIGKYNNEIDTLNNLKSLMTESLKKMEALEKEALKIVVSQHTKIKGAE